MEEITKYSLNNSPRVSLDILNIIYAGTTVTKHHNLVIKLSKYNVLDVTNVQYLKIVTKYVQ